ncbi:EAL domain-containing protein [Shewanella donghaensis]|uniref:EAL domain-containing protein n=1 Tax=Shewanella donghaensis TaxID=238836 RepID=UPI001181E6A8|nr:EAL domain-containing protein [Shewanella donghaensis]
MSLVTHYLHKWNIRLSILLALVCLLPIQNWLISTMTADALSPHDINLTLPLADDFYRHNAITPDTRINKVFVSGSFSDWYSDDPFYEMLPTSAQQWHYALPVHPGDIEYKLVLHVEGQDNPIWILDPNNPQIATNPWGGENSVLYIFDWIKAGSMMQFIMLSIIGALLLFCVLEPFLYWLLHLRMPFYRKLVISNVIILVCAQIVFFGYQLQQNRQLIKLSVSDTLHNMHLLLASNNIDFENLDNQQRHISNTIDNFFSQATTRIDKKQNSLFQITLSDFAVLDKNGQLISLHHRRQNESIQQDRAIKLGFVNTEDYFMNGLWAQLIPQAKEQALAGQLLTQKRPRTMRTIETTRTRQAEWVLGFSQLMQPIVYRGQLKGFYGASIQVKLYGAELFNMLFFQLLLLAAILGLASWLLMRVGKIVTKDILTLTNWTQKIVKGDLNQKISINSQDEIQQLAEDFEIMRESLVDSFKKNEQQNTNLFTEAYFNNLTGLPNRKKLYMDLSEQSAESLIAFNINQFGQINDFYGVKTGDAIIKVISERISKVAEMHTVYKTGANEFVVTISKHINDPLLQQLAETIIDDVTRHAIMVNGNEIHINLSAGGAHCIDENYSQLHQHADLARRIALRHFKRYQLFSLSMADPKAFEENMHQSRMLALAVANDAVTPFIQVIQPINGSSEPKFECLMRIKQGDGTYLPPAMFMKTAIQSRIYPQLMQSMLAKSFALFHDQPYEFSVNISLDDIVLQESVNQLLNLLSSFPNIAKRLTFELLESDEITNYSVVADFISKVRPFGCKIAIDDFGAGYSNFVHLLSLDVDIIKIDGSLIQHLDQDKKAQHLVETVSQFAKKMNIQTVAEFVDSDKVLDMVKHYKIDYAQGFLLGKPQPTIAAALGKD